MPNHPWPRAVRAASTALLSVICAAQAPGELDFEPSQLAVVTIPPNGAVHTISTPVTYTGQNLLLNAPLVIAAGGELRLVRSTLKVAGAVNVAVDGSHRAVLVQEGGRLTLLDSDLLLPNTFQNQYEFRMEGGLLHTERATIGSAYVGSNLAQTRLLHLRGTWLARHTVVQGLVTIVSDGRTGWFGNTAWKGGSVFAKGLFEGDRADALHMSGMGDATLVDGTMNVGLYYDAAAPAAASATIDLNARTPSTLVYGDPTAHVAVTNPILGSPCRIELQNHRSATWQFFAVNASTAGPLQTLTLRNFEDVICNFRGIDLIGSPVLGGPWSSYYTQLPGLPSTTRPGFHAIPPSCSVRLGNVLFQSGSGVNDWNRIRAWGVYARGTATNLSVTGPSHLAELQLTDGHMSIAGSGSFDMAVFANTVRLYQTAQLTLTNVRLGETGLNPGVTGLIEANNSASCTITTARTGPVRLRVTSPSASITTQNVYGVGNLILDNVGSGTLNVVQATPAQATDLQNLSFDAALLAGSPPYWSVQNGSGTLQNGGVAGTPYHQFTTTGAPASVGKQLTLPTETFVSVLGNANVVAPPASGALAITTSQGATSLSRTVANAPLNQWQRALVPMLTTTGSSPVSLGFQATGSPTTVGLDDFRVAIGSWWDEDNLANLGFEGLYRDQGTTPSYAVAPDCWRNFRITCAADAVNVRPGAAPGSRSLTGTLLGTSGNLFKQLTWLRAGDVVTVSGYARGTAGGSANMQVIVGNGANFFVVGAPNVFSGPLPANGTWQSFSLTYTVPANPSYTRIDLGSFGQPGNQFWFDDLTVTVQ